MKKAHLRFFATSTLIRGTWGLNQDTYLAELRFGKKDVPVLVRLVDAYPNEASPLSYATLMAESGLGLRVLRDQECDRPFGAMLLLAVPGALMAVLPMRLNYQPKLDRMPEPETVLPCCRAALTRDESARVCRTNLRPPQLGV